MCLYLHKIYINTVTYEWNFDNLRSITYFQVKPPDFNQILSILSKGAERLGRDETDSETNNTKSLVQKTNGKRHHKNAGEESNLSDQSAENEHYERRAAPQFYVEVGPGSYKSEQVTYPPDFLKNQLTKLMLLKEKRDRKKNLKQS